MTDWTNTLQTGTYRHNGTGKIYEVLYEVVHTETGEAMVVYTRFDSGEWVMRRWCRPKYGPAGFCNNSRFTFLGDNAIEGYDGQ